VRRCDGARACCSSILALTTVLPLAGAPPPAPTQVERIEVRLSLIEVVVVDRRGRHVKGLPGSAFRVSEGSQEIPLVTFDEIDLARQSRTSQPLPDDHTVSSPAPARPRSYLLLIDGYNNLSMLRFSRMRQAAGEWIRRSLRPQDEAAVGAMTPLFSLVTDFTRDPDRLREAINGVSVFPASSVGTDFILEKLQSARGAGALDQRLQNASTVGNDLLSLERDQFYRNLSEAADWLLSREGARSIVLVSGGFPLTRGRGSMATGGLTSQFREALAAIQEAGIRVYAFDIGEEGGFTDTAAASNTRQMVDALGLGTEWLDRMQIGAESDAVSAHQEILSVLGKESGGRFLAGHDYQTGFGIMEDDQRHYYLLGYRPPDAPGQERRYRPLVVTVEDARLRVIARGGRFLSPPPAASSPAETIPLAISCRPLFYPAADGKTLAVLAVRAQGAMEGGLDMELTISAALDGEEVARSRRDISARLTKGFQIRDALVLMPSTPRVSIELRQKDPGRSGRWVGTLVVPLRDRDHFGLTDLALLDPAGTAPLLFDVFRAGEAIAGLEPPGPIADPLGPDDGRRPPPYIGGPFRRVVPLLVQVGVVNPPAPSGTVSNPLRLDWELLPVLGGPPLAPPIRYRRLQVRESENLLDVVADLDLSAVPPGDYDCKVSAANLLTGEQDSRSAPLNVVP
jgi:VWFA-related protein